MQILGSDRLLKKELWLNLRHEKESSRHPRCSLKFCSQEIIAGVETYLPLRDNFLLCEGHFAPIHSFVEVPWRFLDLGRLEDCAPMMCDVARSI